MANINLTIGAVNSTNYLIVTACKTTSPTIVEAEAVYPAEMLNEPLNIVLPEAGSIPAAVYYVTYRESEDGETPGQILGRFTYNAKDKKPISEVRWYQAGGSRGIDPVVDQNELIDPYLDGKNITDLEIEGRPFVPPTETFAEYEFISGGGVRLTNGQLFDPGVITKITITYTLEYEASASDAGMYDDVVLITEDIILTDAHRNKRLKCESSSSRLVVTLEDLDVVPSGKFYWFNSNGGMQKKTKILPVEGQFIRYQGDDYTEFWIGLGEDVRLEKYEDYWEAIAPHPGISMVGEIIKKGLRDVKNTVPADAALLDGDDEPRLWYWVDNFVPPSNKIVTDTVTNVNYVHPVGKEGMWVVHSSLKKFRTPNTQGWMFKGLKDYSNPNTDPSRPYDYPGGTEAANSGEHDHFSFFDNGDTFTATPLTASNKPVKKQGNKAGTGNVNYEYNITGGNKDPNVGKTSKAGTGRTRVDNIGTIYLIRS